MGIWKGRALVVPGPDGATQGEVPACVACGATGSVLRVPMVIEGGEAIAVCLDGHECAKRYRKGASAESYAAGLRGEILGVTP